MAEPTRTANAMQVSIRLAREIEIDYDIHRDDVDTSGENV